MIVIVEGADMVGKTTFCMNRYNLDLAVGHKVAYIHFPIRSQSDVVASPSEVDNFSKCILTGSMSDIQDIILDNIIDNTKAILDMHNNGYHIFIDRYMLSNIAYRKLHDVTLNPLFKIAVNPYYIAVMNAAEHITMIENDEILIARHNSRSRPGLDSLDEVNEQIDNILKANSIFAELKTLVAPQIPGKK
jgi:thymidylate kinase